VWLINREELQKLVDSTSGYALLGGVFSYVGLVWAYTRFYEAIGLAPDEVGVSYLDVLTRSALILAVVWVPIVLLLLSPVNRAIATVATTLFCINLAISALWWEGDPVGWRATREWVSNSWNHIVYTIDDSRTALQNGERVDPVRVAGLTVFGFRAAPATLHWSKPLTSLGVRALDDPSRLSCVLFLGQTDDMIVAFDPKKDKILRVPAADMFAVLDSRDSCDEVLPASNPHDSEMVDVHGHRYVRANLRVDDRNYPVLFPSPTVDEFRGAVEGYLRNRSVHSFRQVDGSEVIISFESVRSVEVSGLGQA
jgi:hypothetical protein